MTKAKEDGTENPGEPETGWDVVSTMFPEVEKIPKTRQKILLGKIRQNLIQEKEEEAEAENIFRLDDVAGLQQMIRRLPFTTDEEIIRQVKELELEQEEAELEVTHWAFRHQAAEGQLLVREELVPFLLTRTKEFSYLLICLNSNPDIPEAFSKAFGQPADAFSGKALFVEDKHWSGWAWFTNPDRDAAGREAHHLKELWKGMQTK